MKISLQATTGFEVLVWRDGTLFNAARVGAENEPQVCVAIDLLEVIAELAGLDLEPTDHAREALDLATTAQTELAQF